MKYWEKNPLPIKWEKLTNREKKAVIKIMENQDVEFIKAMKKTFDSTLIELEIKL